MFVGHQVEGIPRWRVIEKKFYNVNIMVWYKECNICVKFVDVWGCLNIIKCLENERKCYAWYKYVKNIIFAYSVSMFEDV